MPVSLNEGIVSRTFRGRRINAIDALDNIEEYHIDWMFATNRLCLELRSSDYLLVKA
nr:12597_t:CDS:2 [Entrophospora candida]